MAEENGNGKVATGLAGLAAASVAKKTVSPDDLDLIIKIARMLYGETGLRQLLQEAVSKTGTKVDDYAFLLLDKLLCPSGDC